MNESQPSEKRDINMCEVCHAETWQNVVTNGETEVLDDVTSDCRGRVWRPTCPVLSNLHFDGYVDILTPILEATGSAGDVKNVFTFDDVSKMMDCLEVKAAMLDEEVISGSDVIVVTGGNGFLGQHIVKHLQEKGENIREIRVFDLRTFQKNLDYEERYSVTSYIGDIRDYHDVEMTLVGATVVIHTAGLVSYGTLPDAKGMEEININGTLNIVHACLRQNVGRLVYTSTVDVVLSFDDVTNGDETLEYPSHHLFPSYAGSKARAEILVLNANQFKLMKGDGSELHSAVIRPPVMYGEGDGFFVVDGLKAASRNGGVLQRVGDGSSRTQHAYVGNVAWGHVVAMEALARDPARVSGHAYFITDDTPLMNTFEFLSPFLRSRNMRLSDEPIPYLPVYYGLRLLETFCYLIQPVKSINLSTSSAGIHYLCHTTHFSRFKAESLLGYRPLYALDEAVKRSAEYYDFIEL